MRAISALTPSQNKRKIKTRMGVQRMGQSKVGYNAKSGLHERKKIGGEALPVINTDAVLTGIVLLVVVKQSSDWYSAIDES